MASSLDNATQSNYQEIRSSHVHLDWNVNWQAKIISGSVTHSLYSVTSHPVSTAIFDTSFLSISRVLSSSGSPLEYSLGARHETMGSQLTVQLKEALVEGGKVEVTIEYATTKECTALGWLEAAQTGSGKFPFLYSQNQAIHCRSLLPVQDTPSCKFSYTATIRSRLPILMSALRISPSSSSAPVEVDDSKEVTYEYKQVVPIPSYLIAIAGGEVAFAPLGERTGLWIEPGKLDAAVWEFEKDTEKFIATAESLTCEYVWGRYDMLVLPASFPYGGMENSNLTFLTPALITGDRTAVDTICHEICHSWFGNLIGCSSWDSFWLNEGFTTYTERLVAGEHHGEPARAFQFVVGAQRLQADLLRQAGKPAYQRLHIPYKAGEDPDEGFSSIPYEKGANFLLYLERTVGGLEHWKPYLKAYVARFRGLAISTDDWRAHFDSYWAQYPVQAEALKAVDWDAWLNGEGLSLPVEMKYDTTLSDACVALAARWDAARTTTPSPAFSPKDIAAFNANQLGLFLELLEGYEAFPGKVLEEMSTVYPLDTNGNPEILLRWYALALKAGLRAPEAAKWVETAGRMKYCRPTYKAIFKVDPALAKKTSLESGVHFLHPIAIRMIMKDLGLQ